jgi:hypothetical protein
VLLSHSRLRRQRVAGCLDTVTALGMATRPRAAIDRPYAIPRGLTAGARGWTTSVVHQSSRVGRPLDLGHDGDFEAFDDRLARRLYLGSRRGAQLVCLRLVSCSASPVSQKVMTTTLPPFRSTSNCAPVNPLSCRTAESIAWGGPRLIVGTGADGLLPIMAEVYQEAARRNVEIVALPTEAACRLIAEPEPGEVNAVFHVTCQASPRCCPRTAGRFSQREAAPQPG